MNTTTPPVDKAAKPVTVTQTVDVPAEFVGTPSERQANRSSHDWHTYRLDANDVDVVCARCGSYPFHIAADYPCGTEPPRTTITVTRQLHPAEASFWDEVL
jgi:hypothetical protein